MDLTETLGLDPEQIRAALHHYGYGAVALFVGLESIGLPLPGESVLIAAALYAGTARGLDINGVVAAAALAAIVGDNIGYGIGRGLGEPVVMRWGPRIGLTRQRLEAGRRLFARHGAKVVLFGRFVALLRALAATMAGVLSMPWPRFLAANAVGGVLWAALFGYGAYALGDRVKRIVGPTGAVIGAIAIVGFAVAMILAKRHERRLLEPDA